MKFIKHSHIYRGLAAIYNMFCRPCKARLGYCAPTAKLSSPCYVVGYENIYMEENTGISPNSTILTPNAKFIIKKNSGCAPGLFVATGNHERRVGRFYRTIGETDKTSNLDRDVIIEEDCWIGGNVAILCGVSIKRGTTVANGAVVTRDTLPYSIVAGVPARFVKFYWTIDQILEHEKHLYPKEEQYTRKELESIFEQYQNNGTENKL